MTCPLINKLLVIFFFKKNNYESYHTLHIRGYYINESMIQPYLKNMNHLGFPRSKSVKNLLTFIVQF
jgi:hypothetical protein